MSTLHKLLSISARLWPCFLSPLLISGSIPIALAWSPGPPRAATWASAPIGPDGPWTTVQISVGEDPQVLSLFPGRIWETIVPTSDYCSKNTSSVSHCVAGTYSKDKAVQDRLGGVAFRPAPQDVMAGIKMAGDPLDAFYDTCDAVTYETNCSLALVDSQMMVYPGGQWYPIFAGCLSLGAPSQYQTYWADGAINATIIPWYLQEWGLTPSSSFGLHIGSASSAAPVPGSLNFGGYDKMRLVGDALLSDGDFSQPVVLTDVSIEVVKGASPFKYTRKTGLLRAGNSSMPVGGLNVTVDGCSPYLTLPKSTCDAIAEHLPLFYNSSLGLYLWNVTDSSYDNIVRSASVLALNVTDLNKTASVKIKVPFQHLNLTLDSPLTDMPTPYFPCSTGGTGAYVLGRAFLQDAFLGGNWNAGKWWLAQAPGPEIGVNPDVIGIKPSDISIKGDNKDWEASWNSTWSRLAVSDNRKTSPSSKPSASNSHPGSYGGMSTAAIAGIASGVGAAILAVVGMTVFVYLRTIRKMAGASRVVSISKPYHPSVWEIDQTKTPPQVYRPVEVDSRILGRKHQSRLYEMQ